MALNVDEEIVVADKKKFAVSLGVPESVLDKILGAFPISGAGALIGGIVGAKLAVPAIVLKIGGYTLIGASGPAGWIVGGLVGLAAGGGVHYGIKKFKKHLGDTGTFKKEFSGSLSKIGQIVADVVFVPAVYLAKMDWGDERRDFILCCLKEWGYDEEWSKRFLKELSDNSGDILDRTMQIISQKKLGGIKDKHVTKSHLIHRAEELLDKVKQEFAWDQVTVEERKAAIVKRMKECDSN